MWLSYSFCKVNDIDLYQPFQASRKEMHYSSRIFQNECEAVHSLKASGQPKIPVVPPAIHRLSLGPYDNEKVRL